MDREIYEFNIMKSFHLKTSSLRLQHIIRYSIYYIINSKYKESKRRKKKNLGWIICFIFSRRHEDASRRNWKIF